MTSEKHRRSPTAIIPPTQRETGVVFTQAEDGTRTDLHRVRIVKAGPLNLTDANGKLWHARTGESNPPTFPRTFIRRYTRSGPSIPIRDRHSKPVAVYVSDEERAAFEQDANTLGLALSAYFRELARRNHAASQKVS